MRILAALLLATIVAGCATPAQVLDGFRPDAAPDFRVRTIDGEDWQLSAQRGKTVLIDIMAVDCLPCRLQVPLLRQIAHENTHDNFTMVSIEMGTAFPGWGAEDEGAIARFHDEQGLTWDIASDAGGSVFRDYRVLVLPTLVVVRPDGSIEKTLMGERSIDEVRAAIQDATNAE